jgi:LmbE family N-acetylglucosaminyl deacetylase
MSPLPSILVAFAHPDDEAFPTGGTIAHYSKLGHRVVLVCATKGEAGQIKAPELSHTTDLAAVRVEELNASCKALGIEAPIFLGYHDSGRNERLRKDDPAALHNANLWEVEAKIREVIAEVQPIALITFDPHGGYGHPDHLVMHRAATAAFYSSGYLPNPPQRLFYTAFSIERAQKMQQSGQADSIFGGLDPKVYGVSEETIALRMNVQAYIPQKMAAIQAHRSQFAQRTEQMENPERRAFFAQMMATETFSLGGSRGPIPHWPLKDLLDGLESRD